VENSGTIIGSDFFSVLCESVLESCVAVVDWDGERGM
jgi:hypothetical protein